MNRESARTLPWQALGLAPDATSRIDLGREAGRAGLGTPSWGGDNAGFHKLKTVEESQAAVVRVIRVLEEAGQIVMSRGSDELVV